MTNQWLNSEVQSGGQWTLAGGNQVRTSFCVGRFLLMIEPIGWRTSPIRRRSEEEDIEAYASVQDIQSTRPYKTRLGVSLSRLPSAF